jgi:hypothetical protein
MRDLPISNQGKRWTPDDDATVLRDDIELVEMCVLLKRSFQTIRVRRSRLLRELDTLPTPRGNTKWTDADDAMVVRDDIKIADLCRLLGRSWQSVTRRRRHLARNLSTPRHFSRYTPEEDAIVLREDLKMVDICRLLGRSYDSIKWRRRFLRAA